MVEHTSELSKLVDQLTEERFVHRGIDGVNDLQPERPIDRPARLIPIELRRSIIGRIDSSADVVLAKLGSGDQAVRADQSIDHGRNPQRRCPHLAVGDYDAGLHDVASADFRCDAVAGRLKVEMSVGDSG